MIATGTAAPDFELGTQFGTTFRLRDYRGTANVLLLFYPLDFTPTCSTEVPRLEQLADRFAHEAYTQVAACSVDSRYSHANWGVTLGGVSIPMLADFAPKGAVGQAYGVWLPDRQVNDRATVIIDRAGNVVHASTVGVNGKRDVDGLLALAKNLTAGQAGAYPYQRATPPAAPYELYGSQSCGHCRHVLAAVINAGLQNHVRAVEASYGTPGFAELQRRAGGDTRVPRLFTGPATSLVGADEIQPFIGANFGRMKRPA